MALFSCLVHQARNLRSLRALTTANRTRWRSRSENTEALTAPATDAPGLIVPYNLMGLSRGGLSVSRMLRLSVSFSMRLTSYLARPRYTSTTRRRKKKGVVDVQTSLSTGIFTSGIPCPQRTDRGIIVLLSHPSCPSGASTVFQLPYEIFQQIVLNITVLPWTKVYCRYLPNKRWYLPMPRRLWERTRALLALSATCRLMRQAVLMEAWESYPMCRVGYDPQTKTKLLSRCKLLLENPRLASYMRCSTLFVPLGYPDTVLTAQRTLVVDFAGGSKRVTDLFVKCLTALPGLHTLEIVSLREAQIIQSLATALRKREPKLQLWHVRTLILPGRRGYVVDKGHLVRYGLFHSRLPSVR